MSRYVVCGYDEAGNVIVAMTVAASSRPPRSRRLGGRATITAPSDQKPLNRPVAAQWVRTGWPR